MQTLKESVVVNNDTQTLPLELTVSFSPEYTSQLINDTNFVQKHQIQAGKNVEITTSPYSGDLVINSTADSLIGETGPVGPQGPVPAHQWNDTSLMWELPTGGWGQPVDLVGATGLQGIPGVNAITYTPFLSQVLSDKIVFSWVPSDKDAPALPTVTITLPKGPQGDQGVQGIPGSNDYRDIHNKPLINGVVLDGSLTSNTLSLASTSDVNVLNAEVDALQRVIESLENTVANLNERVTALEQKVNP